MIQDDYVHVVYLANASRKVSDASGEDVADVDRLIVFAADNVEAKTLRSLLKGHRPRMEGDFDLSRCWISHSVLRIKGSISDWKVLH